LFYEQIVIDDEIVGAISRLIRGEWADDDTMALDVIEKVGPGKDFLAQRHTLTHMRSEFFMPNLVDRRSFDAWTQSGSMSMRDRARAKVKDILANYKVPPLEKDVQKKLEGIIERAKKPMWGGESKTH
jgi:trimethylamine--corrinoid protein Co-methyltransferase